MIMDRAVRYGGHRGEGRPPAQVPIGWQRKIHQGSVVYISPGGSVLACLEQAKSYLQTDGTCKCGLECPLILHKVFNFDPGAAVTHRTAEDVKADSAVTKLCIHKRKIIAVATLHRSMESQISSGTKGACHTGSLNHQAIRNNLNNGPSNCVAPEDSNYKMLSSGPQRYLHKHHLGSPPQRDVYAVQPRSRPGAGNHNAQRTLYCSSLHSGLLSPPASTTCSSQHYGDGTPCLRSPESAVLGFHRAISPGSAHVNGERFIPLSPPKVLVHGSPSVGPLACALAGRTGVNSLPVKSKSPNRQRSPCGFVQCADYQHKSPSSCGTQQHLPIPQHPPYVVQKRRMSSSEKDPLGILDPIPSITDFQDPTTSTPQRLHINNHLQVASVHALPAVVPLPSNLPMPAVKSGVIGPGAGPGPGPRVQQHPPLSSVSSSSVTSPVHMAVPPSHIRSKETSLHPFPSVSSSQYSSCAAMGAQVSTQRTSHSLQAPVSPPKTSMPLHHLKDSVIQPLVALKTGGSVHLDSSRLTTPRSDVVSPAKLPLKAASRQLDRGGQNPPTFPASSLLSAAAKAQLVHQHNLGVEARGGNLGHPGLVGGGRQMYSAGLEAQYRDVSGFSSSEGQSGRAALRDKLMAQQREELHKRKSPSETDGDMSFHMNLQHSSSPHGYPETIKRLLQQGVSPNDTSMAPLQSMSQQEAQNGLSHASQPSGKSLFFDDHVPPMANLHGHPHLHSRADVPGYRNYSNDCREDQGEPLNTEHCVRQMNQMHNPPFVGNLGYGRHEVKGSICNQNSQQQQMVHHSKLSQGSLSFKEGTGFPPVMSNGGFEMYPESGTARFLDAHWRNSQNGSQQKQQQVASRQLPLQSVDFLPCPDSLSRDSIHHHPSPSPKNGLLRNFKASPAERIMHPARMVLDQPQGTGLPGALFFQVSQQELPKTQGLHPCRGTNGTSDQVKMGLRAETTSSVIVRNGAFSAAHEAVSLELSRPVIHGFPRSHPEEPARRPPAKLEHANGVSSAFQEALLASPGPLRITQTGQWQRHADGGQQHRLWHSGRSLLQAQVLDVKGNDFCTEVLARHAPLTAQEQTLSQMNAIDPRNGLLGQMESGGHTAGSVIQSPEPFPGSQGRPTCFSKGPKQGNGYTNGNLNGNYFSHAKGGFNGSYVPNIVDGKLNEERLGFVSPHCPGLPSAHSCRTQRGGELLWARGPGFQPWPSKLERERAACLCSIGHSVQSETCQLEPHKGWQEDLNSLHKANGFYPSAGVLNDHIDDADQDAVSQWTKLAANVGVVKAPRAKKRKILR